MIIKSHNLHTCAHARAYTHTHTHTHTRTHDTKQRASVYCLLIVCKYTNTHSSKCLDVLRSKASNAYALTRGFPSKYLLLSKSLCSYVLRSKAFYDFTLAGESLGSIVTKENSAMFGTLDCCTWLSKVIERE